MRELYEGMSEALGQPVVRAAYLAELHFASGILYMTDLPYDVTVQGTTYTGAGSLVSVDEVRESDALEASGLKFTLTGVPSESIAMVLGEHVQGKPAHLKLVLFNEENDVIGAPLIEWSGRMDQMRIEDGADSALITVTAESRLADFKRSHVRRYTNEDHQAQHPGDKFFEFVQQTVEREIVWPDRQWFIDIDR